MGCLLNYYFICVLSVDRAISLNSEVNGLSADLFLYFVLSVDKANSINSEVHGLSADLFLYLFLECGQRKLT